MASLWKWGMILMLSYGLVTSHHHEMMVSIMEVGHQTFDLVKTMVLTSCLWSGFLNIAKQAGLLEKLSYVLSPLIHRIFRDPMSLQTKELLSQNIIANLLGMGSMATLSGLKAMENLQKDNPQKEKASRNMLTLVVLNTTGLTLIPTTILSLRQSYHSQSVSQFVPYMILISTTVILIGILIQRMMDHD